MEYTGPENIYWLFSSSAQSIAALIGFLTAGFYFVLDKIDNQVIKDPTLEEINQEIKRFHFKKVKILCVLTSISIISSLLLVYFNAYDFYSKIFIVVIVSIINIATILWAIFFVISIIDPENIIKAVKRLIKEDDNIIEGVRDISNNAIRIGDFIESFVTLENLIRSLGPKDELAYYGIDSNKKFIPLSELFVYIYQRGIIDNEDLKNLYEVNKVRNLAMHGKIEMIDRRIFNMLLDLLEKMIMVLNKKD